MKKQIVGIIGIIILAAIIYGGSWAWKNFRGAGPAVRKPGEDITAKIPTSTDPDLQAAQNKTGLPLKLPKGFVISIFAKVLPDARVMAFDGQGNLWVSQTGQGQISHLVIQNGKILDQNVAFRSLNRPHGLAIDPADASILYFAEETKISKFKMGAGTSPEKIADLPKGGRHFTRTLGFGPDDRLYVSIGSSCDTCVEKDPRLAAIYSMNKDGSDFKQVASGLRNSVFFVWHPITQQLWATEMGRDYLGDNLPPDEINIIQQGLDYGWPICYGHGVHDTQFDPSTSRYGASKNSYSIDPCIRRADPEVELPAHSAPLGLAFAPESWPKAYQNNLLVAFHGSWNRSAPTGYKIARIELDSQGHYIGMEDFISGWLASDGKTVLGRPVNIVFDKNGAMYVSDDKAGVIYKVQSLGNQPAAQTDSAGSPQAGGCAVAGCSGQLCIEASASDNGGMTTCEMRPEYACYQQFGNCTRLANGLCGWEPTEQLAQCLLKYRSP